MKNQRRKGSEVYKSQIIKAADREHRHDKSYRGVTEGFIHRELGDLANPDLTSMVLADMGAIDSQIPVKWTFIDRRVRRVDKHLIGKPATPPKCYNPSSKSFVNTRADR